AVVDVRDDRDVAKVLANGLHNQKSWGLGPALKAAGKTRYCTTQGPSHANKTLKNPKVRLQYRFGRPFPVTAHPAQDGHFRVTFCASPATSLSKRCLDRKPREIRGRPRQESS